MVTAVQGALTSQFLAMPKGSGFVEYERFAAAYDVLYQRTSGFVNWNLRAVEDAFERDHLVLVVVRTMLGVTPSEWAHMVAPVTSVSIDQNAARSIDRAVREAGRWKKGIPRLVGQRITALLSIAVSALAEPAPEESETVVHRLAKADTRQGMDSVRHVARLGVPYAMLLYDGSSGDHSPATAMQCRSS
ncbi:MAG: hypothetical protein ACLQVD_16650 [Capsulimonadaceae bacterium]